ncbi:MAG: CPBP family intramembrane glutamic endopeptidase [Myxococcota bacterium]
MIWKPAKRLWDQLRPALGGMDAASFIIPIAACVSLLLVRYHGGRGAFSRLVGTSLFDWPLPEIHPHLFWFASSFAFYGLLPLLVVAILPGEKLRDYGLGLGDFRLGAKITGVFFVIMVPLVVVASSFSDFSATYPLSRGALTSWPHFLVYQIGYAAYFVGWEFLFRGFLLFGFHKRIGNHAIWLQLIPFVILHAGKPELEAYGSIIAGVALAVLALRTRSFWYGAILHVAVALTMDIVSSWGRIGA